MIELNGKQYRVALTDGGDPAVYQATSFTGRIDGPIQLEVTQHGTFVLAVLEEVEA